MRKASYRYATYRERLIADLIDIAAVALTCGLLFPTLAWLARKRPFGRPSLWIDGFIAGTVTALFALAYWVVGTRTGATPGKRLLGLRVVHETSGRPPSLASSAINVAAAAVTAPVDELVMLGDPHARGLSDRLAGNVVVHV